MTTATISPPGVPAASTAPATASALAGSGRPRTATASRVFLPDSGRAEQFRLGAEELGTYTFATKYARYNATAGRRETYEEAVERVFAMHAARYAGAGIELEIQEAREASLRRLVLGSQRCLQYGGEAVLSKNARLYNCTVSYCDRPRFFQESMWLLLCGCGVGFSAQRHHIARLPPIAQPRGEPVTHRVADSIEGWSDAVGALISSYVTTDHPIPAYAGRRVAFDYSGIRPAGAPISNTAGKAPGPDPLRRSIERLRALLDARLAEHGSGYQLQPIDAYDLVMHVSDAVLSGGVRRAATICIFSPDDEAMAAAKTGDWYTHNPQRARSNNSAMLIRGQTSLEQFTGLMQHVKEYGEPGFVWSNSTEVLFNPCVEIAMYPVDTSSGQSGWQFCNLCEINAKATTRPESFLKACRAAAILGTLQAGYTNFPYLGATTEAITRREALLGVSMTGMADNPAIAFDYDLQDRGAATVLAVNAALAERIGINPCARATCVKPAGTTSCLLGTSSGIHPTHAERYFRRVQANRREAPAGYFQLHNPRAVERGMWSRDANDLCLTFPMISPPGAITRADQSALEFLERVRQTQQHWVASGTRPDRCTIPTTHNVSNTVTVRDHEWNEVTNYIFANQEAFAGISLLPEGGDLEFAQAPFTAVSTPTEVVRRYGVGAMMASGLIVDAVKAFDNNLWSACDAVLGRGQKIEMPALGDNDDVAAYRATAEQVLAKKDILRRMLKFAKNYFSGDVRRMTHCLKEVNNLKLWEDLTRDYQHVDYTLLHEATDDTKLAETVACAGGKCDHP